MAIISIGSNLAGGSADDFVIGQPLEGQSMTLAGGSGDDFIAVEGGPFLRSSDLSASRSAAVDITTLTKGFATSFPYRTSYVDPLSPPTAQLLIESTGREIWFKINMSEAGRLVITPDLALNRIGGVSQIRLDIYNASGLLVQSQINIDYEYNIYLNYVTVGDYSVRIRNANGEPIPVGQAFQLWVTGPRLDVTPAVVAAAGNSTAYGGAGFDQLHGGRGDDFMDGGADNDSLYGGDGDDILTDLLGKNTFDGGTGLNIITAGAGNDEIYVRGTADTVYAGSGSDNITQFTWSNRIYGGAGNDAIELNGSLIGETVFQGSSLIYGGDGDDRLFSSGTIYGEAGDDVIGGQFLIRGVGGEGDDTFYYRRYSIARTLLGNNGDDTLIGGNYSDKLYGGDGNDFFTGTGGTDTYLGEAGNDIFDIDLGDNAIIYGGSGNDRLNYLYGADENGQITFDGGDGIDLVTVKDYFGGPLTESLNVNVANSTLTLSNYTITFTLLNTEGFIGSNYGDTFTGSNASDQFYGAHGEDSLFGGAGADKLYGGSGNDTLTGGLGNDTLSGGLGNDIFMVTDAGDLVFDTGGRDVIIASSDFTLTGTAGIETIRPIDVYSEVGVRLIGNVFAQQIDGTSGDDWLGDGGGVTDTALGFGGDFLSGQGGNDTYLIGNSNTTIQELVGQSSRDRIATSVDYKIETDVEIEILTTSSSTGTTAINLFGNNLRPSITGNAGANRIWDGGGAGVDRMAGLNGDDVYFVSHTNTSVTETANSGRDALYADCDFTLTEAHSIEIMGITYFEETGLRLTLIGNSLSQTFYGGAGQDTLDGKGGSDVFFGDEGADSFVFTTAPSTSNIDRIADFEIGVDDIVLENSVFRGLSGSALSSSAFDILGQGALPNQNTRVIYDSATGALFFDADGTGAGARVLFLELSAGLALTSSDFRII